MQLQHKLWVTSHLGGFPDFHSFVKVKLTKTMSWWKMLKVSFRGSVLARVQLKRVFKLYTNLKQNFKVYRVTLATSMYTHHDDHYTRKHISEDSRQQLSTFWIWMRTSKCMPLQFLKTSCLDYILAIDGQYHKCQKNSLGNKIENCRLG